MKSEELKLNAESLFAVLSAITYMGTSNDGQSTPSELCIAEIAKALTKERKQGVLDGLEMAGAVVKDSLYQAGRRDEARTASRAIAQLRADKIKEFAIAEIPEKLDAA